MWATLVAVVGLSASFGASRLVDNDARADAAGLMDRRVAVAQATVAGETRRYAGVVSQLAAAVGAQRDLRAADFAALSAALRPQELPGASSVAFVVSATPAQIPEVQRRWRAQGAAGLKLRASGSRPQHLFTTFVQSLADQETMAGRDLSVAAEPVEAFTEAARSGQVTVSDTYVLVKDRQLPASQQQQSFILVAPVYDAAGNGGLRGWVSMAVRGQAFMDGVLRSASQGVMDIVLRAGAGDGHLVPVASILSGQRRADGLVRQVSVPVAQQHWLLEFRNTTQVLPGMDTYLTAVVFNSGALVSLLLAALVLTLARARDRALLQVAKATAELRTDIERRREAESQLRSARDELAHREQFLDEVLNAIDVMVLACDADGRLTHENDYSRRLHSELGAPGSDDAWHVGAPAWFTEADGVTPLPRERTPLLRALSEGSVEGAEMMIHGADTRPRVLLAHARQLRTANGALRGAVVVCSDITQLREYQKQLGRFAGVVAHDLKAPLASIGGYIEVIADACAELPQDLRSRLPLPFLGKVQAGVDRMSRLIEDLLAHSTARSAVLQPEDVDLDRLVAEVVGERTGHLQAAAGSTGSLLPEIYVGPLPQVRADAGLVRQVIDNLIGNALKYVQPGKAPRIDITATPGSSAMARIEIADRGIGIPEDKRDEIFASFTRLHLDAGYEGTGLGLSICQEIIERHGGHIGVTANPGGGSCFWLTLPASPVPDPQQPARQLTLT